MFPGGRATLCAHLQAGLAALTLMAAAVLLPTRGVRRRSHRPRRCATSSTRFGPSSRTPAPRSTSATPTRRTGPNTATTRTSTAPISKPAVGPGPAVEPRRLAGQPRRVGHGHRRASRTDSTATPNFHCVLAVDGVVVKTAQGPKGRALLDPHLVRGSATPRCHARRSRGRFSLQLPQPGSRRTPASRSVRPTSPAPSP